MTPNLAPNNPKGQSENYHDFTNTPDQSNHSSHFIEGQRSTPCFFVMQPSDWLLTFGGVHLNFPHIQITKMEKPNKCWLKKKKIAI